MTPASADGPLRLLAVDDDIAITQLLVKFFGAQGFVVEAALSVDVAMTKVDATVVGMSPPFAAVLSDFRMPSASGLDGLSLLRHVRQSFPMTGFILLSAQIDEALHARAVLLGADRVLLKPQTFKDLGRHVQEVLVARGHRVAPTGA